MSTEETRRLAHQHQETLNRAVSTGDFGLLEATTAKDFVEHNPSPGPGGGSALANWKQSLGWLKLSFPDMQFNVEQIIADGDKAVVYVTIAGTHRGDAMGVPATGRAVVMPAIDILRFEGGKVVEHWGVYDELSMLRQLGLAPQPGA